MAENAKKAPATADPAVNGISSLSDSLSMAQNLRAAISSFASQEGFHILSQLTDLIPQLNKNIGERDDRIEGLVKQVEIERNSHSTEQQKQLEVYSGKYDTWKEEKAIFQKTIEELQNEIHKEHSAVTARQNELEDYKAKGRELESKYKEKVAKLKGKDQEIKDLRDKLRESEADAADSSKNWSESRDREAKLQASLKMSRDQHNKLKQEFGVTNERLNELLSFTTPLHDVDLRSK